MAAAGVRVMYLHSLRAGPKSIRSTHLVGVYGQDAVRSPNLKTRRTLAIFTTLFVIFVMALIAAAVLGFLLWSVVAGALLTVLLAGVGVLTYILAGRGVTHYMLMNAVAAAEKTFQEFRPNVIVASSFGSVVAVTMRVPRVGLVLLAPALDAYCRYMRIRELPSLYGYPYSVIVHGSSDDVISLDDSIRLVETCEFGRCKLEVIDDNHTLRTLCEGDFRDFVDEVYTRAREEVQKMVTAGKLETAAGAPGAIDPTLFDLPAPPKESEAPEVP